MYIFLHLTFYNITYLYIVIIIIIIIIVFAFSPTLEQC